MLDEIFYIGDIPYYYKDFVFGKLRAYIQPYISTNYNANYVVEGIYISDLASSCNLEKLKGDGITHILSAILGLAPIYPEEFTYKNVEVRDIAHENIHQYFEETNKYIGDCLAGGGKILVHCSYGISRSSSLIMAYLIGRLGYTYADAYHLMKSRRGIIEPNIGFKKQLLIYSLECDRVRNRVRNRDLPTAN